MKRFGLAIGIALLAAAVLTAVAQDHPTIEMLSDSQRSLATTIGLVMLATAGLMLLTYFDRNSAATM